MVMDTVEHIDEPFFGINVVVLACGEEGVDLITGRAASGVKLAGTSYRLYYGTSEVVIALPNRKRKQASKDVTR